MQEKREEARRKAAAAKRRKAGNEAQMQAVDPPKNGEAKELTHAAAPGAADTKSSPQQPGPLVPRNGMVVSAAELRELGGWNRRGAKRDEDPDRDVAPWLRALKCREDEIQRGRELCEAIPDATVEEKLKYALKGLRGGLNRKIPYVPSPAST
jgi:hypothetical protein